MAIGLSLSRSGTLLSIVLALGTLASASNHALAAPTGYSLVGSFPLPRSNEFVPADPFDVLSDGRILQARGDGLWLQTQINGATYTRVGSLGGGLVSAAGPSFIRVSPDGLHLAVGSNDFTPSNQSVHIVPLSSLDTIVPSNASVSVSALGFDAVWSSNEALLVTGGDFFVGSSLVSRITLGPSPQTTVVVESAGAGSGGIAIIGPTVYVGVGFGFDSTPSGQIRSFDLATLSTANTPSDFSLAPTLTRILSAFPLAADSAGNLLAGGGDSFATPPLLGFAAVIDPADPTNPLLLSPGGADSLYSVAFNSITNEALIIADGIAYRYAIPTPGALGAFGIGLATSGILSSPHRRRRSSKSGVRA